VGAWARVRAGLYKGDLAKVVDVDHSAGRALVRLVPRLDYAALAQRREEGRQPGLPFGQMPAVRPPARCARGARSGCCGPALPRRLRCRATIRTAVRRSRRHSSIG